MLTGDASADDLARLRHERENADRAYNEALTALDKATQRLQELPSPPPPYDESQIASLNQLRELLPLRPAEPRAWLRRLRSYIWGTVAPVFDRQQAFNAALVEHINRNAAMHRETANSIASTLAVVRDHMVRAIEFHWRLILYAQQITPYVDTKDRYVAGLPNALAAGIDGLSDELQKRWESMVARERRYEAQVNEVRTTLSVMQRAVATVKRELEQRGTAVAVPGASPLLEAASPSDSGSLNSYKYVGFEDQFRGSPKEIRDRMAAYVSDFTGLRDVLDVGCGRGEFLDLLREQGIPARGVDINNEMAAICRSRGLEASSGDALGYLLAQPDGSLGGLFAAQVVEHLQPDYLMRLLETAYHKLRPGSKIVLETINPACWYAFFSSYIRDVTHVRPLHPDTLRYLLVASGFQRVEIRYSAPFPDESKLQALPVAGQVGAAAEPAPDDPLSEMTKVFNDNITKLNSLLFTYLDYAVIGERL
jgi:O-antigen chain-terminating methyltransferase